MADCPEPKPPLVALLLVNPDLNPNRLQIGQMIRIPQRITWRLVEGKQTYTYTHMINDLRKLLDAYPFFIAQTLAVPF